MANNENKELSYSTLIFILIFSILVLILGSVGLYYFLHLRGYTIKSKLKYSEYSCNKNHSILEKSQKLETWRKINNADGILERDTSKYIDVPKATCDVCNRILSENDYCHRCSMGLMSSNNKGNNYVRHWYHICEVCYPKLIKDKR